MQTSVPRMNKDVQARDSLRYLDNRLPPVMGSTGLVSLASALLHDAPRLQQMASAFAARQWVVLPSFIPLTALTQMVEAIGSANLGFEKIVTTKHGAQWALHMLDDGLEPFQTDTGDDLFSRTLLSAEVVDVLCTIAGVSEKDLLTTKRWINRYLNGQFITPHVDTTGDFQALLCLAAPPPGHGGELQIGCHAQIVLAPGDLLLFAASSVQHRTFPLLSSEQIPEPMRLTGVCRFYLREGIRPDSRVAIFDEGGNVVGYRYKDVQTEA